MMSSAYIVVLGLCLTARVLLGEDIVGNGLDFVFPFGSSEPKVELVFPNNRSRPNMKEATYCAFVNMEDKGGRRFHTLLNYWVNDEQQVAIFFDGKVDAGLQIFRSAALFDPPKYGSWVHVCFTWSSFTGGTSVYINGAESQVHGDEEVLAQGNVIPGGGRFVLGYQVNPHEIDVGFRGKITQVNVWGRVLSKAEVTKVFEGELFGNVIDWRSATWKLLDSAQSVPSTAPNS